MKIAKYLGLGLLCLGLLTGCAANTLSAAPRNITLVAKSTETEFWQSVFAGARAAASEYNVNLAIHGPETEEDYETQNALIEEAVAQGAEALVFSAISYTENAPAIDAAAEAGVKIVVIDSDVASRSGGRPHRHGQRRGRLHGGPGGAGCPGGGLGRGNHQLRPGQPQRAGAGAGPPGAAGPGGHEWGKSTP